MRSPVPDLSLVMLVTTAFILFTALLVSAGASLSPTDRPAETAKVTSTKAKIQGKLSSFGDAKAHSGASSSSKFTRTEYYGCSPLQRRVLSEAIEEVQRYARAAYMDLKVNPTGSPLYTRWFGSFQPSVYRAVLESSTQLRTLPQSWKYQCQKTCTPDEHGKPLAWADANRPGAFNLCPAFWNTTLAQHSNLRAFTIIQEGTRFEEVAGTHKIEYGSPNSIQLAKENPFAARNNADNHAYFLLGAWGKKLEKGSKSRVPAKLWLNKLQAGKSRVSSKIRLAKTRLSRPGN